MGEATNLICGGSPKDTMRVGKKLSANLCHSGSSYTAVRLVRKQCNITVTWNTLGNLLELQGALEGNATSKHVKSLSEAPASEFHCGSMQ